MSQTPLVGAEAARCLFFDSQGMMWIGTEQGLLRYDGYRFRNFRSDAYSPGILPNNFVRTLTEDHDGNLWIGTHDGVVRLDRRSGKFVTYHLDGEQQRIVNTLFTSRDGTIWVGTNGSASYYQKQEDRFVSYTTPSAVMSFAEDSKGNFFVGVWENGLMRLDRKTGRMVKYPVLNTRNTPYSMMVDSRDRLWIGSWECGIDRLNRPADEKEPDIQHFNEHRQDFRTYYRLVEDSVSHAVWGCCLEGITRIDIGNGYVENYGGLFRFCNDIQTDGCGNLWVLTQNNGVAHLNTVPSTFNNYMLPVSGQQLPVDCIQTVFTADGQHFWLSLRPYGLALYNRVTGEAAYGSRIPGFGGLKGGDEVYLQAIRDITQVGDQLWMGSSHGLLVWREGCDVALYNGRNTSYLSPTSVNAVCRQRNGMVWIGQTSHVSVASTPMQGKRLTMNEGNDDFSNCDARSFFEDSKGCLWIATENRGIIRVSGDARRPSSLSYHHYYSGNGKFPIDDATACYEDSRGRLWAISSSGGLFRYDEDSDSFLPVNKRYHIMGGSVYSIEEDALGGLWLTTDHALVRLSFSSDDTPVVTSYGVEDGLFNLRFSANASFRYRNELFFGSQKGFFSFIPDEKLPLMSTKPAQLVVTDLLIDNHPYESLDSALQRRILDTTPSVARKIVIPASVDKFTIEFALLAYSHQEQIRYKYRLEGYDDEWHFAGMQQRSVTFQNLPAGNYRLHLKAADSYGQWTELPYTIQIKILPPWYLTWWAWLIYVLLAALAVYGLVRWYKNYLKTKNRLAMGVLFTNITHELLTPLTVISASVDDMRGKAPQFADNYGLIQNNIQRLTRLLRQILEVRKSQAGQLRLLVARGDLSSFVTTECENIRPMVEARGGKLFVSCPSEPVDAWFDKDKLDKIIYNLLSNAVKYNREGGNVSVDLTAADGKARLTVSDEGIGISKDKMKHLYTRFLDGDYRRMNTMGTGIGLSLAHDLVLLHHGHIDCQSEQGVGTTFTVTLPVSRESFAESEIDYTADNRLDGTPIVEDLETADATIGENANGDGQHEYSMLIVEDNSELLELMRNLFATQYNVYTARNGQQALNIIHRRDLDIVITDVMMPVMDGIELTREIKNSPDFGQLPVVVLTAKTTEEDQLAGYETGADAYITKPFKLASLKLRIDNIIQNRERIRRKFVSQTDFQVQEQHYSSPDEVFIQRCVDIVRQHLDDSDFDREQFAAAMCVSSSTLYNKLRALTGQNVTGFINSIRLKEACRILCQQPDIRISELAMTVGFNTPKYFTKCFKKEFGLLPKEFVENGEAKDAVTDADE